MVQAELREASIVVSQKIKEHCDGRGTPCSHFALAWCLANPILTSVIIGPRTMEQFDDNLGCLDVEWDGKLVKLDKDGERGCSVRWCGEVERRNRNAIAFDASSECFNLLDQRIHLRRDVGLQLGQLGRVRLHGR